MDPIKLFFILAIVVIAVIVIVMIVHDSKKKSTSTDKPSNKPVIPNPLSDAGCINLFTDKSKDLMYAHYEGDNQCSMWFYPDGKKSCADVCKEESALSTGNPFPYAVCAVERGEGKCDHVNKIYNTPFSCACSNINKIINIT